MAQSGCGSPFGFGIIPPNGLVAQLLSRLGLTPPCVGRRGGGGSGGHTPPPACQPGRLQFTIGGQNGTVRVKAGAMTTWEIRCGTQYDTPVMSWSSTGGQSGSGGQPPQFDSTGTWTKATTIPSSWKGSTWTLYFTDGSATSNTIALVVS